MATQMMRAMLTHSYGGSESLRLEETPRPVPEEGCVLVRVHAVGLQPKDWLILEGVFKESQPVTFPFIPGVEVAGVVEEVGPGVAADRLGQAVLGRVARGGYAEYVSVSVKALARKPKALSFIEAAAFPDGALTAWRALFDNAGLTAGQQMLIQGVNGMVVFAIQLAKWKGARVTSSALEKHREFVLSLGAEQFVDITTTPAERMDLVLHGGASATVSSALAALRDGGTLISNAALRPEERAQVQEREIRAVTSQGVATVPLETLTGLVEEGYLKAPVGKSFALDEAVQAHAYAQSGQGFGRFALRIVEDDSVMS